MLKNLTTVLILPYPPSTNHLQTSGQGRRYSTRHYREWKESAGWALKAQTVAAVQPPYRIRIIAARPDRRKRDLDNLIKPLLDLLQAHEIITGDHLVEDIHIWWDRLGQVENGVMIEVHHYDG